MGRKKLDDKEKKKRYQVYLTEYQIEELQKTCKCIMIEQVTEQFENNKLKNNEKSD